jgi:tripartite-type tricarboxylate transporter receptor subunit TctC
MQSMGRMWMGLICAIYLWGVGFASAQNYPARALRMILPFPPGGPTDLVGRLLASKLSEQMGQPVPTDNRPGASGNIGLELATKAPADGYTLVLTSPVISLSHHLYTQLTFDPMKELAPISMVGAVFNVVLVHPSIPAHNLQALIQLARARPGALSYGSGGMGTTTHLAPELLKSLAKINIVHVPYKGSGVALIGLASGQVDLLVMAASSAMAQIKAQKVRPIAVLTEKRLSYLPSVPTANESGIKNAEVLVWYGLLTVTGTAPALINRLNSEVIKAVNAPDTQERFLAAGIEPMTGTPEQFGQFIRSESVRFGQVIQQAGIRGE